jgi:hypothetical protein
VSDDRPATVTGEVTAETQPPAKAAGAAALIPMGERGIALRNMDDLLRFARLAVEGGAAPKGMSPGAAAIAIQAGLERGMGPLGGLQNGVVINGVLSWRGQAAVALIRQSGLCVPGTFKFWHEGEGDNLKGVAVAHRVHDPKPERREFTVKDARQARLWGKDGPWTQYPARQLMWRAVGFLARDVFSDVLGGFALAEEAQDFAPVEVEVSRGSKAELLPPPGPDPLMDALGLAASKPVEAAPFASHAEADAALAAQEREEEAQ